MNRLFDLINAWANRLVIRVYRLVGVPETTITSVANALEHREQAVSEADKKFIRSGRGIKWLILLFCLGGLGFIILKIIQLRK